MFPAYICDRCGEAYYTVETSRKIDAVMVDAHSGRLCCRPLAAGEVEFCPGKGLLEGSSGLLSGSARDSEVGRSSGPAEEGFSSSLLQEIRLFRSLPPGVEAFTSSLGDLLCVFGRVVNEKTGSPVTASVLVLENVMRVSFVQKCLQPWL